MMTNFGSARDLMEIVLLNFELFLREWIPAPQIPPVCFAIALLVRPAGPILRVRRSLGPCLP